ncbi:3-hydroxyacyl-[acyl-carrier-protein] dehydratase FabZ [Lactobacillus murinus]|nr:3-hydroxyacyl-[acyl-carrier-protein] dehydratase FabZ [Ligilactobacillus murinus]NEG00185.1 3-hydroxyacyl-[acyl-carrier-protein] dehydratase FabZ [Ligilactobacillus murinus]NEG11606.1 3-hydroxyacyl-[acyl-carrier-protein] dehydratase FabZ [Ligilactobacillus murinus]NEG20576.1 3-hydroxyacyl-[acyl-carrier-protein] dehydratase FabZ [Ligilactobacillus murinus]NEG25118.1 3-hydroxyacyl-[acyl-carrier-protein] dehydratase FabZ [Ligilactobacillus murinus]
MLPHRYPLLLIDRIEELEPGKSARALRCVTEQEALFAGQGSSVLPETLIIGSLAQTGACALLTLPEFVGKTAYFGGIKAAEFMCSVYPRDVLELEVKLEKIKSSIGSGKATAKVAGQVVCLVELAFMIG